MNNNNHDLLRDYVFYVDKREKYERFMCALHDPLESTTINGHAYLPGWFGYEDCDNPRVLAKPEWLQISYLQKRCRKIHDRDLVLRDHPHLYEAVLKHARLRAIANQEIQAA